MCREAKSLSLDYIVTLLSDMIFRLRVTHSSQWHLMDSHPFIDSHAYYDRLDMGNVYSRNGVINGIVRVKSY